jgi:DNA-directed RNA polymerase subunit M/transcription elongation factor TFIIS
MTEITCPNCDGTMTVVAQEGYGFTWRCSDCGYEEQRGDEEDNFEE